MLDQGNREIVVDPWWTKNRKRRETIDIFCTNSYLYLYRIYRRTHDYLEKSSACISKNEIEIEIEVEIQ
jgi:hypothetical protein